MEKTMCVAKALYDMYYEATGTKMDEMKMHKLMYFSQRESLMEGTKLFEDAFFGWKYGPVLKKVRSAYQANSESPFGEVTEDVSESTKTLLSGVVDRYGKKTAWKLSSLSHGELSWKKSREGLKPDENGDKELSLPLMKIDALREKYRREYEAS